MPIEFVVTAGPHVGRAFVFTDHSTFLVGRSSRAHFSLPAKDPFVSRLHFLVEVNPPLCRLRDMGGANGTQVNGSRVQQADLKDGDVIRIGQTELVVRLTPEPAAVSPGNQDDSHVMTAVFQPGDATPRTIPQSRHADPDATRTADHFPSVAAETGDQLPTIPGYRLDGLLGKGGMGAVYRAVHLDTGDQVAVKTILPAARPTGPAITKFIREADTVRRLDHTGIVRFRESGVAGGQVWFAMELVSGEDAAQVAARERPLAVGRVAGWAVQLLAALGYAHRMGYVHRDVKPANLLVTRAGGGEVVKLTDFGLARAYEASPLSGLTLTGAAGGTPTFMPPEQVLDMRSAKPAADQYGAAATVYRLLAGESLYPPTATVQELFKRILEEDPVPIRDRRPDLPPGLAAAVHRALARDPAARFPNVAAFAAELGRFV